MTTPYYFKLLRLFGPKWFLKIKHILKGQAFANIQDIQKDMLQILK